MTNRPTWEYVEKESYDNGKLLGLFKTKNDGII